MTERDAAIQEIYKSKAIDNWLELKAKRRLIETMRLELDRIENKCFFAPHESIEDLRRRLSQIKEALRYNANKLE